MAANSRLKSYIEQIELLDEANRQNNSDKSEIYKTAKSNGYDVKIIRKVLAIRKNGRDQHLEDEAKITEYLNEIGYI